MNAAAYAERVRKRLNAEQRRRNDVAAIIVADLEPIHMTVIVIFFDTRGGLNGTWFASPRTS